MTLYDIADFSHKNNMDEMVGNVVSESWSEDTDDPDAADSLTTLSAGFLIIARRAYCVNVGV